MVVPVGVFAIAATSDGTFGVVGTVSPEIFDCGDSFVVTGAPPILLPDDSNGCILGIVGNVFGILTSANLIGLDGNVGIVVAGNIFFLGDDVTVTAGKFGGWFCAAIADAIAGLFVLWRLAFLTFEKS